MSSPLLPYVVRNYAEVKRSYPTEGRRRWRLRIAGQFWDAVRLAGVSSDSVQESHAILQDAVSEFDTDLDQLDGATCNAPQLGLIVRTDFSDERSWLAFCTGLQASEKELILGNDNRIDYDESEQQLQSDNGDEQGDESSTDGEEELDDAPPSSIFYIVNPSTPQERSLLTNASNLTVLRLFNDVDVRPSPTRPDGMGQISPPNRLVDYQGWQEIYEGKNVWVYDNRSIVDQCVRVVSQSGDMYGTATGDSWRARVSHISELQVNLTAGVIRIDFGGLDRWDFNERRRNMIEAEAESLHLV